MKPTKKVIPPAPVPTPSTTPPEPAKADFGAGLRELETKVLDKAKEIREAYRVAIVSSITKAKAKAKTPAKAPAEPELICCLSCRALLPRAMFSQSQLTQHAHQAVCRECTAKEQGYKSTKPTGLIAYRGHLLTPEQFREALKAAETPTLPLEKFSCK